MSEKTSLPEQDNPAAPGNAPAPLTRANPDANLAPRISIIYLTLAVLAAIFIWQWLDGQRAISDMQQQLARKIAEMGVASKTDRILLAENQDQVRELSAKVTVLETRFAELQNRRTRDALNKEMSANRIETVLAEIEQTLLMAGQQLRLSGNVKAALIAIQSADTRLQHMNRPAFGGIRKAISMDMEKLRAFPGVDIAGINTRINDLVAAVDRLPLAYQQHAASAAVAQTIPPKDETVLQKLLREIGQEAKQLVRIQDTGKEEIPLLMPDQEFFLRENLKLHLLSARIALLSRDENSFSRELETAQLWTNRYFDGKSDATMRMLAELQKLAATDIGIALPDIGAGLQAIQNYRLTHENGPKTNFGERPKAAR